MNEYPHTITFQQKTKIPDGSGGYTEDWTTFKVVDAFVQPLSGSKYLLAQQLQSKINYKVFMDFDSEINSKLRIDYNGKILNIDAPIDQGGLEEVLCLLCVSEVSQ
jgi:SPP1 family predicted phage head-tail adaptor